MTELIIPRRYREFLQKGLKNYFGSGDGLMINKVHEIYAVNKEGVEFPIELLITSIHQGEKQHFCAFIRDIRDRKLAQQKLEITNEALRKLTVHLQEIREEERSNIAREIHDELGQQLTVLKMDISWLNKRIQTNDENVRTRMRELLSMVDTTMKSVRRISSKLRPSILDDLGLPSAIEWQGQEFEKRSGIKVRTSLNVSDLKLPDNIAITLFRIFQESLTNVARHAKANEVQVSLRISGNNLELEIADNGKGFETSSIINKKTLGLLGMRERVSIINGEYSIESAPGKGTRVKVSVPISNIDQSKLQYASDPDR